MDFASVHSRHGSFGQQLDLRSVSQNPPGLGIGQTPTFGHRQKCGQFGSVICEKKDPCETCLVSNQNKRHNSSDHVWLSSFESNYPLGRFVQELR